MGHLLRASSIPQDEKFTGGIPAEWGMLTNLIELEICSCHLWGHVPKELANLGKLQKLILYRNNLQVPQGASLDENGYMIYDSRKTVAAFQKCLK